jgi:hypothetical protein
MGAVLCVTGWFQPGLRVGWTPAAGVYELRGSHSVRWHINTPVSFCLHGQSQLVTDHGSQAAVAQGPVPTVSGR